MKTLERVARALCVLNHGNELIWADYMPDARAALTALLEPSGLMIDYGEAKLSRYPETSAEYIFQAMIQQALKEGEPGGD